MALNPKEMGDAIARNMRERTGKTVEEWVALMKAAHLSDKKQVVESLKSQHALGHYQAITVWEHLQGTADAYEDGDKLVSALFAKYAGQRVLYDSVVAKVMALGPDVRIEPCKTYLPLYRKTQFAVIKPSKAGLLVGLALDESVKHPRLTPASKLGGSARITRQLTLQNVEDWDAAFEKLLRRAYEAN